MELREIDEPPKHEPDVAPHLLANLTPSDKYVIETLSVLKQDIAWVQDIALKAYNMAVRHENNERRAWKFLVSAIAGAVVTEGVHWIFLK